MAQVYVKNQVKGKEDGENKTIYSNNSRLYWA